MHKFSKNFSFLFTELHCDKYKKFVLEDILVIYQFISSFIFSMIIHYIGTVVFIK